MQQAARQNNNGLLEMDQVFQFLKDKKIAMIYHKKLDRHTLHDEIGELVKA